MEGTLLFFSVTGEESPVSPAPVVPDTYEPGSKSTAQMNNLPIVDMAPAGERYEHCIDYHLYHLGDRRSFDERMESAIRACGGEP